MRFPSRVGFGLGLLLTSGFLLAQDVPLHDWPVPSEARPAQGGITTMADVTDPRLFVGIQPCRVADTRGNGAPIQGGIFANSAQRTWDVTGICGIPADADALSVNFSVVAALGIPPGSFLLAWPTGQAPPPTAIMTYGPGQIISNAAIVPLGPGEQLNVNVSGSTHVIMDVNGYFSDTLQTPSNFLSLINNSLTLTARFTNLSTTCTDTCGLSVFVESGGAISANSVELTSDTNQAINGNVSSSGAYSSGVQGLALAGSGRTFGIFGRSLSTGIDAAGVYGLGASGEYGGPRTLAADVGVWGESRNGYGVVGQSSGTAGLFYRRNFLGTTLQSAWIASSTGGGYAVYALVGDFGGTGAKYFVEPHPTDATKVIKYVSLEGPESGTYFRGRAKFQNGLARISVPESFRIVTDEQGLSIQVTPIGQMATFAVERIGLDEIVVRGSRNVEFFYMVNGVRRAFKDHQPISDAINGGEFMPSNADARMPAYPEELKRRLVQNGTYNADGTVNLQTAHSAGWDRIWEEKSRPQSQPISHTPTP
jgi:hypothetical protein